MFGEPTPENPNRNDEAAANAACRRDDVLMVRVAQSGDTNAFGQLVRAHEMRVSRFALRMLGESRRETAQDVTQETFLRVWRSRSEYVPSGSFSSYLLRIAHRLCLDALRKAARQNTVPLDEWAGAWDTAALYPPPFVPSAEHVFVARSLIEAVQRAVAALPENERAVFILSHYEAVPYHEIAHILNCPMGTVASRKHRAVQTLRRALDAWKPGGKETP